jgi:uncharacterized protein (DUF58 family)
VNGKAATLLALAMGLLLAALATRRGEVAGLAAPLLTLLAAGVLRAPAPGGARLRAQRTVRRDGAGGVAVEVVVRNEGPAPVHLRLADAPFPAQGGARTRALLAVGGETTLAYSLRAPRGHFAWRAVAAAVADPLGLVEVPLDLPAPGEVHLQPEAARLRPLPLQPGRTLPAPGTVPARVGGSGTDFYGVREYHVGDALRWLDWHSNARHPGKLFTKEFEREEMADVGLVLDARPTADDRVGRESLFEHTVRAAASLAATCLRQGNRVSLLVLGRTEARVFPGVGRVQLQRILSCLAAARAGPERALPEPGRSYVRLFPAGSILFVLSPFGADDAPFLLRLHAHGRRVVLVSPDPIDFHAPGVGEDPVSRLALRAARVERRLALAAVAQDHIPVVDWPVHRPLDPLLRAALRPRRGGATGRGRP